MEDKVMLIKMRGKFKKKKNLKNEGSTKEIDEET